MRSSRPWIRWTLLGVLVAALPHLAHAARGIPIAAQVSTGAPAPGEVDRVEEARRAWYESLHRSAPGTDWHAIEKANATANFLIRQAQNSAEGAQSGPPGGWTELGSVSQTGRNHVTALSTDGLSLYIGTSRGGLWKGLVSGSSFSPISDNVGLGVHMLTISPGSPEVILTATQDGSLRYTINGGGAWAVPGGLPDAVWQCVRLRRDPGNTRKIYALFEAWRWTGTEFDHSYQLWRSDDGGRNFNYLRSEPLAARPDLWISRTAAGPLYLLVADTLKKSTDNGTTFTDVGHLPEAGDDAVLAGCEAGAPKLYAAVHAGSEWHLYNSVNAGVSWTLKSTFTDFWRSLCASIADVNLVLVGGVNCRFSHDGGATLININDWADYYADPAHKLHADIDGIDCIKRGSTEYFYINTDGGTYSTTNAGATVTNLTQINFRNAQFYSTLTSIHNPYLVAGGSQDQGYQISHPEQGVPQMKFEQSLSGDYGHLSSSDHTLNMVYSTYPGFVLVQRTETYAPPLDQVTYPTGENFDFLANLEADPDNPDVCYVCGQWLWTLHRVSGSSYTWTASPQDFSSGDPNNWLTALTIAPGDHNQWYAATKNGDLWYSGDHGSTWNLSAAAGPQSHYFYGTALLVSPADPNLCFVGGAGYSGAAVYRTTDGGVNWTPMGTGLPSTLVFTLALDAPGHGELYAASEAGPYRYDAGTSQWVSVLSGAAPLTTYWSVEGVPALGTVRFGTYGRGIWDYNTAQVVAGVSTGGAGAPELALSPNPSSQRCVVRYSQAQAGPVKVEVFDVAGRRLAVPVDGGRPAGASTFNLELRGPDGRAFGSGIYLVRLTTPGGARVAKLNVLN